MQNYLFISDMTIPLVYPKITLIIFESSTHQQLLELTVCYIPPPSLSIQLPRLLQKKMVF